MTSDMSRTLVTADQAPNPPTGTGSPTGTGVVFHFEKLPNGGERVELQQMVTENNEGDSQTGVMYKFKKSKSPPEAPFWDHHRKVLAIALAIWFSTGVILCKTGFIAEEQDGDGLTIIETIYWMLQIVTTVGYGDLFPETDAGRICTAFYILFAGLLISGFISEVIDVFLSSRQDKMDATVKNMFSDGGDEISFFEHNAKLLWASFHFAMAVLVWATFFRFECYLFVLRDPHDVCIERTFVETVYFGIITMTTVGFGDILPGTALGELFACFGMLVGIACYAHLVGAVADRLIDMKAKVRLQSLAEDDITMADKSHDGQVDLYEFTAMMLSRYNLVSSDILDAIKDNFDELDVDKSGSLSMLDVVMMSEKHKQAAGGKKGETGGTSP